MDQVIGIPWLVIADGDDTYYQRLFWEPWIPSLHEDLVVDVRRAGGGPFVIDIPGFGRVWPAGPAKQRPPLLETLEPRRHSRYRLSRIPTLIIFSGVVTFLASTLTVWPANLVVAGHSWLVILYVGGAPIPVPWLTPRRYPRINRPRSSQD